MREFAPVLFGAAAGFVLAALLFGGEADPPPAPRAKPQPQLAERVPELAPAEPPARLPPPAVAPLRPPAPPVVRPAEPPRGANLPAWQRFAVAVPPSAGRPLIAILIDDMGVDRRRSDRIAALPGPLTLSFLTYGREVAPQAAAARALGHELMVHLPMEPESRAADPGPEALRVGQPPQEIARRVDWALSRFPGFVGINNHEGSRFTADAAGMAIVMDALARRGLLFVDSRTTAKTVGPRLARERNVPFAERSVFLDNENESSQVRARLAQTERAARQTGYAIAIGHPRDATIAALGAWLPTLAERGFALVPVSTIVRHRQDIARRTARAP